MTKEFVQSNMSNLLEDIRRNCISINLGVVDTQCDTPVDALYDAYTWLIKNDKIELDA